MLRKSFALGVCAFACFADVSTVGAAVVTNGGFEATTPPSGVGYEAFATTVGPVDSWTYSGYSGVQTSGGAYFGFSEFAPTPTSVGTPTPNNIAFLENFEPTQSSISQTVTFSGPGLYVLTYDEAKRVGPNGAYGNVTYNVTLSNQLVPTVDTHTTDTDAAGFLTRTVPVTVTALGVSTATLTFITDTGRTGGSGDDTVYFDNIAINNATPEPTSIGVLAVTGVGLLARRRRQI